MSDPRTVQGNGGIEWESLVPAGIAVVLLYVCGWSVAWAETLRTSKALLIGKQGLMVRFNDAYYGLELTQRFFDSPALSWLAFSAAFALIGVPVFLFGDSDD
ncbi:hypothetical protein LDO31_04050 [Luteimonas sp. XNQY3]|nr:hypothetical protein [Luteimonas sp. XNQY3]MCD9005420.1 hypothetical protein [Luteimonas sp. XNQY3]